MTTARLRAANDTLRDTYANLVAALGGPELVDAYRDALAERLRAEGAFWSNTDTVECCALEVEREIRL